MNIKTNQGTLEAEAWHVGRHVMIVAPGLNEGIRGGHFRVDGKPVAEIYQALQRRGKSIVAWEEQNIYMNIIIDIDTDCTLSINDAPPIVLEREAHMELLAVFETAFTQATLGLTESRETDERRRYGLPPRE